MSAAAEAQRTRWVELSAALTAVVVSVGSLLVARHQAEVMDRQLAAQVWPTAGKTVHFFALPPDTGQRALWRALDRERFQVAARVCYCSVLDECWVMTSGAEEVDPARVASCAGEQKAPQYR